MFVHLAAGRKFGASNNPRQFVNRGGLAII
jgi:hypothetical protein